MKKNIYGTVLLIASLITSINTFGAHHLEGENSYKEGQQAVLDAFGWDLKKAEITIERINENNHVLFGLGGNILVNSGKDGVLIVDDQFPQLKNKIMSAIRKIGGRKIDYIVNSHWHFDHAEGNIAFGKTGSRIIAHENSRFMMINPQPINLVSVVYPQQPYPSHALPQITYQDTMTVNINGEEIGLYNFGSAHTTGDTAVYLKQSNILHMGDVFNTSGFPFIDAGNGGNIDGIINFCRSVLSVVNDETIVVPGHGPISTTQDMQNYIDMLIVVRDRIKNLIDKEKTLDEILDAHPAQEWEARFGDATMLVDRAYTGLIN
jgi:glyoxylase-like metal-dependent hydrolase (beta-lactamase superfamily II)